MPEYKLLAGSKYEHFQKSRAKFQVLGGAYAAGKTAAVCIKTLEIARDYPGSNILLGRSTYPKLNDTLRKEFFKWCPRQWVKRMPTEKDNTCYLINGSVINFRYVQQRGKGKDEDTSNLLSATYDLIVIDQFEDPEFSYKDFVDLIGRLRGSTPYRGADHTMPTSGPRWFIFTANPTANWLYKRVVRPLQVFKETGRRIDGLLQTSDGALLADLFEVTTYDNAHVLAADVIQTLESTYTGQYRDRFLLGKWAQYEGLVYPMFNHEQHVVRHEEAIEYLYKLHRIGAQPVWLRGYDHGIAKQSCFLLGYADHFGNAVVLDGFYEPEKSVPWLARAIQGIEEEHTADPHPVYADPSIFRRSGTIGPTVADQFLQQGVSMQRAANRLEGGIMKIVTYLAPVEYRRNPFTQNWGSPTLFVSEKCEFLIDEFLTYRWQRDPVGEFTDEPVDRNNHALDALRYMMTRREAVGSIERRVPIHERAFMKWNEPPDEDDRVDSRAHRYA